MAGHIKIDRRILNWEWYRDVNTCRLFFHLLLKANWKEGRFKGVEIPRGSFVTSYQSLSDETGLSIKNVRTALNHLKVTGEVAVNRHPKFSVITVKNYCQYQTDGTVIGREPAENRQSTGSQPATIEEGNKERREEKKDNMSSPTSGDRPAYPYEDIIAYLNLRAGTHYRHTSEDSREHIRARCAEGYTLDDFKAVIDKKVQEWKGTEHERYLRPATLFGMKFESYLNQRIVSGNGAKPTGFSNFQQRDYDMDALEEQLLQAQRMKDAGIF